MTVPPTDSPTMPTRAGWTSGWAQSTSSVRARSQRSSASRLRPSIASCTWVRSHDVQVGRVPVGALAERAQVGGQHHIAALCEPMPVVAPVRADVVAQAIVATVDGAHLVLAPTQAVLVLREHRGTRCHPVVGHEQPGGAAQVRARRRRRSCRAGSDRSPRWTRPRPRAARRTAAARATPRGGRGIAPSSHAGPPRRRGGRDPRAPWPRARGGSAARGRSSC